jgi:primase-polymerase (primpol)-like protein
MTMTAIPNKPRTFNADLAHLPAALLPLTRLNRWVIWKWELRANNKWTKPPYNPRFHNQPAKSNDPATWGSYTDAVLAFTQGLCDGIGLMLKDGEVAAIDLDHIRDFATGQVLQWAEELFAEASRAGCYIEWTVSGTGARIIGVARGSELHKRINVNRKTRRRQARRVPRNHQAA